jgi:siroheme synthase (precorrin-2 oxidase/ferrochelatase)
MRLGPLLVLVAGLGALGCGRIREVRECRALARLVNPAFDEIAERVAKDRGAASYRFAAARYGKLAIDLGRFRLGIPRAERTVAELTDAMTNASTQSAKLADALEKNDIVIVGNFRRDLSQLARQQKSIMMRISDDCSGS